MPLSEPAPRTPLHGRDIILRGYQREDELWDIEGHLTDTKTYEFESDWRGTMPPGRPFHDMAVRLTVDDDFIVQGIDVAMDSAPFSICNAIEPDFDVLVGEKIGTGWRRRIRELVGGTKGCTHVLELLGTMATATIHTIATEKARRAREAGADPDTAVRQAQPGKRKKPFFIDGCHAWDSRGPQVKKNFPEFYRGDE